MAVTQVPQSNVQFPSDDQPVGASSKQIESGGPVSLKQTPPQADSLAISDQGKGTAAKNSSLQSTIPTIPAPDPSLILANQREMEAEVEVNPYFTQGAVMAAFWIIMQDEIIPMMAEIRKQEKEYSITTREAKYETSIELAQLQAESKRKEALDQFTQAIGSGIQAVNSTVTLARQSTSQAKAENEFNKELQSKKTALDKVDTDITKFQGKDEVKLLTSQVGAPPTTTQDQLLKEAMQNPAVDPTLKAEYNTLMDNKKKAQDEVDYMNKNKFNNITTKENTLTQMINMQSRIVENTVQMMTGTISGTIKLSQAALQEEIGEAQANAELYSNYLQEQEKSMDRASQSHSSLISTLNQNYQTYMRTISGQA